MVSYNQGVAIAVSLLGFARVTSALSFTIYSGLNCNLRVDNFNPPSNIGCTSIDNEGSTIGSVELLTGISNPNCQAVFYSDLSCNNPQIIVDEANAVDFKCLSANGNNLLAYTVENC
ncbi:hypothetical protein ACQKWADRAFT_311026 [Trichoderma austrokoningii]